MADITSAEAIRYTNEVIRPLAEEFRALKVRVDAALVQWFAGMDKTITNDASAVKDGRDSEGVSRLSGSDIVNFISQLAAFQAQLNAAGVANVVAKPCVRALSVQ